MILSLNILKSIAFDISFLYDNTNKKLDRFLKNRVTTQEDENNGLYRLRSVLCRVHGRVHSVHRLRARPFRSRPRQPLLRVSERRADVLQEAEQEPEEDEQQEPDHEDAQNSVRHQD